MIYESLEISVKTLAALAEFRAQRAIYEQDDSLGNHERLMDAADMLAEAFSLDMEENGA